MTCTLRLLLVSIVISNLACARLPDHGLLPVYSDIVNIPSFARAQGCPYTGMTLRAFRDLELVGVELPRMSGGLRQFQIKGYPARFVIDEDFGRVQGWDVEGELTSTIAHLGALAAAGQVDSFRLRIMRYAAITSSTAKVLLQLYRLCPQEGITVTQLEVALGQPAHLLRSVGAGDRDAVILRYRSHPGVENYDFHFSNDSLRVIRKWED